MRPVPIPDEAVWESGTRTVLSAPGGDLTDPDIAPVEAIIEPTRIAGRPTRMYSVMIALEDGDLEHLQAGGNVWLTFWGCVVPFSVSAAGPTVGGD